jgi:hypothetical protein
VGAAAAAAVVAKLFGVAVVAAAAVEVTSFAAAAAAAIEVTSSAAAAAAAVGCSHLGYFAESAFAPCCRCFAALALQAATAHHAVAGSAAAADAAAHLPHSRCASRHHPACLVTLGA